MLEVTVNINREHIVAQLHAVRIKPKSGKIKDGTTCTYNIIYDGFVVGTMKGKYGCGVDLAIALLKKFKENSTLYKTFTLHERIKRWD